MKLSLHVLPVAATTLILAGALSASAALIAYEEFAYPPQPTYLGNQHGGTGWMVNIANGKQTGWWSGGACMATNQAAGLSYSKAVYNGALHVQHGSTVLGNVGGSSATAASSQRLLPNTLTNLVGGAGTIWISFLYQNWNTDTAGLSGYREAKIGLFRGGTTNSLGIPSASGTETMNFGTANTYQSAGLGDVISVWSSATATSGFAKTTVATPRGTASTAVFCVARLDFDATTANDTITAWVNPWLSFAAKGDANYAPAGGLALTSVNLGGINTIRIQTGGKNASGTNAIAVFDEIRVGTTFWDVAPIPEPASFGLATLGGLALLALRRKRS